MATSENDGLALFSSDGKRMLRQKFGDATSLEAVPASPSSSILVAINDLNAGREEIIGVRLDRVLFRVPIGRNKFTSSVSWRLRRIVPGRFIGTSPQFAVLRGDGSLVVFDLDGRPLSLLPSNRSRAAIELGPPLHGRDTLLACEGKSLSRLIFPVMAKEVAAARAAIDNPNKELLRISERDTSDDLWARALWLSVSDTAPTGEEIASLFKAALARTKQKAPIYVSFGDVVSGPNSWMDVLGGALETMAVSLGKNLASHAKEIENEHPKADKGLDPKQVGEIYKNSMVDAGTQIVSDLNRAEKEEGFRAMVLYRAAVAEDPSNKAAWFRLAYFAHGELQAHAIAESIRVDPQNAFPYYVRAIIEVQQGNLAAARDSVRAGNERPFFSAYEIPLPKTVRLNYPDHEWLRDLGLVGRPIPRSAFVFFVRLHTSVFTRLQLFSHNDLSPRLREVALKFFGEAERLQKLGKTNEVAAWLEILHGMGIQLMRFEPRDSTVCLTGMGIASDACAELKHAYQALGDKSKLQRTEASAKRLKQWIDEYMAARYPRGVKAEDENTIMREAARGSRDFLKEEQQILETTLRHSGLIAAPQPPAR